MLEIQGLYCRRKIPISNLQICREMDTSLRVRGDECPQLQYLGRCKLEMLSKTKLDT